MPDFDLSRLIVDALDDPSPIESVFRVKTAVANELSALDPTATIKSTGHFNHTYAPDFVMSWRDKVERSVFLRLTDDPSWLSEEIGLIESESPLVLDLAQRTLQPEDVEELTVATRQTHAMVSQPEALERLIHLKSAESTASMVSNALAQGGRGVFVEGNAVDFAAAVSAGFYGAADLEADITAEAIGEIKATLGEPQAWRMTRVLQAVWEGSSGRLDLFPGQADLSGRLNSESLEYLLIYMDTDDPDFWRRVGRGLSLADITGLTIELPNDNVSRLIQSNLDIISARACVVFDNPIGVNEAAPAGPAWGLRGGFLSLESPRYFAIVAETKDTLRPTIQEGQHAPSVAAFIDRTSTTNLEEVTVQSGSEVLTLRNEDTAIDGARLTQVAATYTEATSVTHAVARSLSGRVNVDFKSSTGTGHTRSNLLMADLLSTTVPLTVPLDREDMDSLEGFLAYETGPDDPTSVVLFDDFDTIPSGESSFEG